jgi:hypothetical protein
MVSQTTDSAPPATHIQTTETQPQPEPERGAIWPFIWTLFVFKAVTLGATFYFATRSNADISILVATHWFWLGIPIVAIAGPMGYQWRVRRVRRRRAELRAAEWMLDAQ